MIDVLVNTLVPIFPVMELSCLGGLIRDPCRLGDHHRLVGALTERIVPVFTAGW